MGVMGDITPMHSCVSLLPITLFSGLKNLNRKVAKNAKVFRQDQQDGTGLVPAAAPLLKVICHPFYANLRHGSFQTF